MSKATFLGMILVTLNSIAACASSPDVIPQDLNAQVDKQLQFSQLIQNPDVHKGKLIVIGGEVLHAKGLKEGTELEILQLPLDDWQRPINRRTTSKGRVLALQKKFRDPATFPPGIFVTLVGEITGSRLAPLDETEYQYPTFTIKHLHIWEKQTYGGSQRTQPRWSVFGGGSTGGRVGGGVGIGIGF